MTNIENFIIRVPTKAELLLLSDIESKADELFPPGTLSEDMQDCTIDELTESLSGGFLYVAEADDQLVGFCISRVLAEYLHLQQLSVLPDYARKGIGTALLTTIINLAISHNFPGVTLTAFSNIPWNAPFYSNQGFTVISDIKKFNELELLLKYEASIGLTNRVAMLYRISDKLLHQKTD